MGQCRSDLDETSRSKSGCTLGAVSASRVNPVPCICGAALAMLPRLQPCNLPIFPTRATEHYSVRAQPVGAGSIVCSVVHHLRCWGPHWTPNSATGGAPAGERDDGVDAGHDGGPRAAGGAQRAAVGRRQALHRPDARRRPQVVRAADSAPAWHDMTCFDSCARGKAIKAWPGAFVTSFRQRMYRRTGKAALAALLLCFGVAALPPCVDSSGGAELLWHHGPHTSPTPEHTPPGGLPGGWRACSACASSASWRSSPSRSWRRRQGSRRTPAMTVTRVSRAAPACALAAGFSKACGLRTQCGIRP